MKSSPPFEQPVAVAPEGRQPRGQPLLGASEGQTIRAALGLAILLTLATAVVSSSPEFLSRWMPSIRARWPYGLLITQLAAMGALVAFWGLPRSRAGKAVLAATNLEMLELAVLAYTHALEGSLGRVMEVAIRASVLGVWAFVLLGFPAVVWRLFTRQRDRARSPFTLGKWWFAAAMLLLMGEPCAVVVERVYWTAKPIAFPESLPVPPAGELRVVTVGESSMVGFPYDDRFSIPRVVEWQLRQMYPGRKVVVEDISGRNLNLELALAKLAGLTWRPHLLLLYSGHNEFVHHLEELSALVETTPWTMFDRWVAWSPSFRVFDRAVARKVVLKDLEGGHARQLVDVDVATPTVKQHRLERFRSQLEQLARWCHRSNIASLWFVPAAPEADFEPNRSCLAHPAEIWERADLTRISREARSLEAAGRWGDASQRFREGLARYPGFADFHYQLAECLMRTGDHEEAARNYALALEHDGHPMRATAPYRAQVAETAAQFVIPVVDSDAALRPHTPFAILDRSVFLDHCHPNLHGYYYLGMAAVKQVEQSGLLHSGFGQPAAPTRTDFASAIQWAGVNANDLATGYDRLIGANVFMTRLRYEDSRLKRDRAQFSEWSRRLQSKEIAPGESGTESLK